MCSVCVDFEQRLTADNVDLSLGAIAQVVERLHGMEKAEGSSPSSSTSQLVEADILTRSFLAGIRDLHRSIGFVLAGFVAGEGTFVTTSAGEDRNDGSRRTRFVFKVSVADRDAPVLIALRTFLGGRGSIQTAAPRNPRWQSIASYSVSSRKAVRDVVIPFGETFLLPCAKCDQFEQWRDAFVRYEAAHPTQWGRGPSTCSEPGCDESVRGRGLCRSHYYRVTGY
jgi:hypothetical protein